MTKRLVSKTICPGGVVVDRSLKNYYRLDATNSKGVVKIVICPGGEIGRRKGLKILSTQTGNFWREWSQIRGNLSGNADGNPELSFGMINSFL